MNSYFRVSLIAFMGILSVYFYYFYYTFHAENKGYYIMYLIIVFCIYGIYKLFQSLLSEKVTLGYNHIAVFLLLQLFVLCCMLTGISGLGPLLGSVIFLKVIIFLVLCVLLWLIIYGVGNTVLHHLQFFKIEDFAFQKLGSIGGGFFLFMLGIFTLAAAGLYNPVSVGIFILVCFGISYKSIFQVISSIKNYKWSYNTSKPGESMKLFIDEMHYGVISLLLSINLLSVFRPFPIGWDDLGAYMNLPKILVGEGGFVAFGRNYTWELYTGIGHVFSSQTFAFFLNSFSGILLAIISYIALKSILRSEKTLFNIPLLGVLVLLMMPMSIFQLAKDMKLDIGLFAMSIIPLYLSYYYLSHSDEIQKSGSSNKALLFIGILIGFCFSIKITSLLLLLGILGTLAFKRFSLYGILGYIGLLFGIFSIGDIWGIMNVSFPHSQEIFGIMSFIFGMGILSWGVKKIGSYKPVISILSQTGIILVGFFIAISPWVVKNIIELPQGEQLGIKTLITGKSEAFIADFTSIYSQNELDSIQNKIDSQQGTNEDFGRYFGYEGGINNYLKLPWNLTFQVNQKGEFTEIGFIFFALIPVVFLFLPYRREIYKLPVIGIGALLLLYYIPGIKIPLGWNSEGALVVGHISNGISSMTSGLLNSVTLPYGYAVIFMMFLSSFLYLFWALKREEKNVDIFLTSYSFCLIYVFLWNISSFGVVWYGVVMYFMFFLLIALCLIHAHDNDKHTGYLGIYVTLGIIWVYILMSVIPHGVTNMRAAGHMDYKLGKQTEEEAIFYTHPEYFPILFELNIAPEYQDELLIEYRTKLLEIIDDIPNSSELVSVIGGVTDITQLKNNMSQLLKFDIGEVESDIRDLQQSLFEEVIFVSPEKRSEKIIYRAGTFMKYYISENNKRLFEDSLIERYDRYIHDEDLDEVKSRLGKLGISYILLDLNAATIDQDPKKELTRRYEDLLSFVTHKDVSLVETDSICLKVAMDDYDVSGGIKNFLDIATLNHGNRSVKKAQCITRIIQLLKGKKVSQENYSYLLAFQNALDTLEVDQSDDTAIAIALNKYVNQGYKALFKIHH